MKRIVFLLLSICLIKTSWAESAKELLANITPSGMVAEDKLLKAAGANELFEGAKNAPITIIEYYSLTCGHCADFYLNTLPVIRRKYIATGKVRLIEREFPYDARALAAFMLVRCAPKEQREALVKVLFNKFMDWVPADDAMTPLKNIAKLSGFSDKTFAACLANEDLLQKLKLSTKKAKTAFGLTASPTFFINGEKYVGSLTVEEISTIIDNLLKHKHK